MKAQEFLHLRQVSMSVREFFTKLSSLSKYVLSIASSDRDKLDVFLSRLRLDIAKDIMIGDNPLKSLLEALG